MSDSRWTSVYIPQPNVYFHASAGLSQKAMIRQKESASVCLSAVCVCVDTVHTCACVCVCEGRIGGPAGTTLVNNGSFIPAEQ